MIKLKDVITEGAATKQFDKELKALISTVQKEMKTRKDLAKYTDGEILAMYLKPSFQSILNDLEDRKGFTKNFTI